MNIKPALTAIFLSLYAAVPLSSECVILLHGLARSPDSMNALGKKLEQSGYRVANIGYPSRQMNIEQLAEFAVKAGIAQCATLDASPLNFVTHSLGGILVRQYYSSHQPENIKRVVMLGPPNNGSEVVDRMKNIPGYALLNGPAGMQLGTDSDSTPIKLGPVNFELGVIAGTRSINLILSSLLPNPDDGKVSVASAKIEGMCGFITLPTTHPFMMKSEPVMAQVISFLRNGRFNGEKAMANCVSTHQISSPRQHQNP